MPTSTPADEFLAAPTDDRLARLRSGEAVGRILTAEKLRDVENAVIALLGPLPKSVDPQLRAELVRPDFWDRTSAQDDQGRPVRTVYSERVLRAVETPQSVEDYLRELAGLKPGEGDILTLEVVTQGPQHAKEGGNGPLWTQTTHVSYVRGLVTDDHRYPGGELEAVRRWQWPAAVSADAGRRPVAEVVAEGLTAANLLDYLPGEAAPFMKPGFQLRLLTTPEHFQHFATCVAQEVAGNPALRVTHRRAGLRRLLGLSQAALEDMFRKTNPHRWRNLRHDARIVDTPEGVLDGLQTSANLGGPGRRGSFVVDVTIFADGEQHDPVSYGYTVYQGRRNVTEGVYVHPWQGVAENKAQQAKALRPARERAWNLPVQLLPGSVETGKRR